MNQCGAILLIQQFIDQMSIKNVFIEQLMSQRSHRNKRIYIIKKPILLFPLATQEIPPTPKQSKQLRSRSEHPHRKNKTVPIKQGQIIHNFKIDAPNNKSFKTEQKRTERSSQKQQKEVPVKKYESSILMASSSMLPRKPMKDYLIFIRALPEQSYQILANFDILRKRHRRQSLRINQRTIFQFISKTLYSIYENLTQKNIKGTTMIECCHRYFSCFQKIKLQVLFSIYYPNNLHPKIRPFLIYQRLIIFLISLLCTDSAIEKLTPMQKESLRLMVQLISESYNALFQPIRQQEEQVLTHINETFRMLKAAGEVEKKCQILQRQLRKINIQSYLYLQVQNDLKPLKQSKQEWPLEQLTQIQMKLNWEFLKIPPVPYLPMKSNDKKYTLVIQLDQTLIFYDKETKILKYRPYLDLMLNKILPFFEIVVFTKADSKYAEVLVGQIERNTRIFSYILSQQHLTYTMEGKIIKDISKMGRELKSMVVIDCLSAMYRKYSTNGIEIESWHGDKSDKGLQRVLHILLELAESKTNNVPQALLKYQKKSFLQIQ